MNTITPSQQTQWWLAELDQYDNVKRLCDGSHSTRDGADHAWKLYNFLKLKTTGVKYAIVKCEVFPTSNDLTLPDDETKRTWTEILSPKEEINEKNTT